MAGNSYSGHEWEYLIAFVLLILYSIWTIRRGEALSGGATVKRSQDPTLFWFVVITTALIGIAGAVSVIVELIRCCHE